jgi:site-specific recombinase XerD
VKAAGPMAVKQLMKHAKFSTTEIYIHLAAEDAEEGSKNIGDAFDSIMG